MLQKARLANDLSCVQAKFCAQAEATHIVYERGCLQKGLFAVQHVFMACADENRLACTRQADIEKAPFFGFITFGCCAGKKGRGVAALIRLLQAWKEPGPFEGQQAVIKPGKEHGTEFETL